MKIISLIVTVGFLIYYFAIGVYDPFSLTSTSDIKSNYSNYVNKTIKLQQVAILNTEVVKKEKEEYFIKLIIYNSKSLFGKLDTTDYLKYKDSAIDVYGWIPDKSELWGYVNKVWFKAEYFKLKVDTNFIAIFEYAAGDSFAETADSWFIAPYLISFMLLNSFLPLSVSAILATGIQLYIIFIIVQLIIEGTISVLPSA
jgi:hypothetical protein